MKNCDHCFENSFSSNDKSKFWNDKNILKPRQVFKGSSEKFLFNCKKCYNEYLISLSNITYGYGCPFCKHKTELKLFNWLKEKFPNYSIETQKKFDWCKKTTHLPFDFFIKEINLIIELDGRQHFEQVSNWKNPKDTKINDEFKNKLALENVFKIIRICQEIVWNNKENWEEQLLNSIKNFKKLSKKYIGQIYLKN